MKKIHYLLFLFLVSGIFKSKAQNTSVAIGGWREHVPFNKAIDITEDNQGKIYCATTFGLFTYHKSNGELNTLSRLKELSDQEIVEIEFDKVTGVVLIAYANSNIDLIFPDKSVSNLPDIKLKNIIGGKRINSIIFINGFGYLGCDFGIVVVDINRREIKDTYYIAPNGVQLIIHDIAYNGTDMIAATDNGIYRANFNDPNLFNYTAWTKEVNLTEPNADYTSAAGYKGLFYAVKTRPNYEGDTVLVYKNNQWSPVTWYVTERAFIDADENYLYYGDIYVYRIFNESGVEINTLPGSMYANSNMMRGYLDTDNNLWIADFVNGLIVKRSNNAIERFHPNGPSSEAAWHMASKNGTLWVSTGAIVGDGPVYSAKNGVFRFSDNQWKSFDCTNDVIYQTMCNGGSPAVNYVAIDPSNSDHAFIASWGGGVLEYRETGGVERYRLYNSTLHNLGGDTNIINVGGVEFDADGNLWAISCGTSRPISVRTPDGKWQDFIVPETSISGFSIYNMLVDDYGQKWFCARGASTGQGLCVFKEKSLTDPNGASFKRLNQNTGTGALPDLYVRSIAKDKDGSIWIGGLGVSVIYNPGNVFTGGNYDAQKIIIQQDGYNQYLLETEYVNAIAIDGANRKWFGTYSGGVFLMSADGQKQIANFNMSNSPLPSNSISSIAIDDQSGEVFIATDKGIVSYRGDATEGGDECSNYFAFPNPVRSEYKGPIAIRGLVANADVKIADVAGNVVYHTKANGGEAIWNGNNFSGERAKTGVYVVYITNDDGSATCTTKILVGN